MTETELAAWNKEHWEMLTNIASERLNFLPYHIDIINWKVYNINTNKKIKRS